MSANKGLVTWGGVESLGEIPGGSWLYLPHLYGVAAKAEAGVEITDDVLLDLGAERHHVKGLQYPEGYHAVTIVDSDSGEELTTSDATNRYFGLMQGGCTCGCQGPAYTHFLFNKGLPLDEQRHDLTTTFMTPEGPQSIIAPHGKIWQVDRGARITPGARRLQVNARGKVPTGGVTLSVEEADGLASARLALHTYGPERPSESTVIRFDGSGEPVRAEIIGENTREMITRPDEIRTALDGVARALGQLRWKGALDLRLTAARAYADMGKDDVAGSLAFRDK